MSKMGEIYSALLEMGPVIASVKGKADGGAKTGHVYFADGTSVSLRKVKRLPRRGKPIEES